MHCVCNIYNIILFSSTFSSDRFVVNCTCFLNLRQFSVSTFNVSCILITCPSSTCWFCVMLSIIIHFTRSSPFFIFRTFCHLDNNFSGSYVVLISFLLSVTFSCNCDEEFVIIFTCSKASSPKLLSCDKFSNWTIEITNMLLQNIRGKSTSVVLHFFYRYIIRNGIFYSYVDLLFSLESFLRLLHIFYLVLSSSAILLAFHGEPDWKCSRNRQSTQTISCHPRC